MMAKMKTLTVSGQTYTVCDPEAVRSVDGQKPDEDGNIRVIDDNLAGHLAWSGRQIADKLCPAFTGGGSVVVCEPVEGYPLTVAAEDGATAITRCGKNLFDPAHFTAAGLTENNGVYSGTTAQLRNKQFLVDGKEDAQYTLSFRYKETGNTNGANLFVYLSYTDSTWDTVQTKIGAGEQSITATTTAGKELKWVNFSYGQDVAMCLWDVQLEIGNTATDYVPFQSSATFVPGEPVPALPGVNTLYADIGEITVTGKSDPVAIIEKLTNAMIALGGNV